jgi:hypothetical protein
MSAPADRVRSIQYGCFASLSMTGQRWHSEQFVIPSVARNPVRGCFTALRFVQHDKSEDVIPNAVRNPVVDASLCSA